MTDIDAVIREVRKLDAKATSGPWTRGIGNEYRLVRSGLGPTVAADCGADNGNLIAEYRTAAPLLAAEVERLRDILAAVAAPLAIDGPNHAASVKHARDALKLEEK